MPLKISPNELKLKLNFEPRSAQHAAARQPAAAARAEASNFLGCSQGTVLVLAICAPVLSDPTTTILRDIIFPTRSHVLAFSYSYMRDR